MRRRSPSNPTLLFSARLGSGHVSFLRKHLRAALHHLPYNALVEVSIALVGDAEMSTLHSRSHNDPTPTDVLTYEIDHDPRGRVTEGQIVICLPEARRRATSAKIPVREELLLYALHGLLHLCGHDDLKKADFTRMHRLEDHILTAIGIGPLFYRPEKPAPNAGGRSRTKAAGK
jgi:probable rRNA maturation factor